MNNKQNNNLINIGDLYNRFPKSLNAFYDWLDNKYNIVDYIDRFKQYLFNDVMFKHYMVEFLDEHNYYIYIKPITPSDSFDENNDKMMFKYCINNIPYDTTSVRFDCELNAIIKCLMMIEKY